MRCAGEWARRHSPVSSREGPPPQPAALQGQSRRQREWPRPRPNGSARQPMQPMRRQEAAMNARCGSTARRSKICKPRRFLRRFPNFRGNANGELYSMPQAPATRRTAAAGRFYSFIQLIDLIEENPVMYIFSECATMPSELVIGDLRFGEAAGSFVSAKPLPNDYDGTWETVGVDPGQLDPVLLDFSNRRAAMKSKYLGELFPETFSAQPSVLFRDFFQSDRDGVPKGVVQIDLGSLP